MRRRLPGCGREHASPPRRDAKGMHSLEPSDYRPAVEAVRRAVGNSLVLQLTSEAVGIYTPSGSLG